MGRNNSDVGNPSDAKRSGLCHRCAHMRRVSHPREGKAYLRCALSEKDARFDKYPRLPIIDCVGFETAERPVED